MLNVFKVLTKGVLERGLKVAEAIKGCQVCYRGVERSKEKGC